MFAPASEEQGEGSEERGEGNGRRLQQASAAHAVPLCGRLLMHGCSAACHLAGRAPPHLF